MSNGDLVLLGHGSGGRLSHQLVAERFLPSLGNRALAELLDSAVLDDLALTTDAYVVSPRFFPGGDLGRLAICGTVNDLAMVGAVPEALVAAFVLEEGLPLAELDAIVASMAAAAREAGVAVVAGDTKVVPRGACDGVFITTSGLGRMRPGFRPRPQLIASGDAVLVSGTLGDHGIAVMAARQELSFASTVRSDVAPLAGLVGALAEAGLEVHALRDPTRGGAAQSLIELATGAGLRLVIEEAALPIAPPVRSACEILGLDPLYVANEGKLIAVLPTAQAEAALAVMRGLPVGAGARRIGEVLPGPAGCELRTLSGGRRSLRMAAGELLPRIC